MSYGKGRISQDGARSSEVMAKSHKIQNKTKQNENTAERTTTPGSRIGHNQGAFPTPVQGALVTYV